MHRTRSADEMPAQSRRLAAPMRPTKRKREGDPRRREGTSAALRGTSWGSAVRDASTGVVQFLLIPIRLDDVLGKIQSGRQRWRAFKAERDCQRQDRSQRCRRSLTLAVFNRDQAPAGLVLRNTLDVYDRLRGHGATAQPAGRGDHRKIEADILRLCQYMKTDHVIRGKCLSDDVASVQCLKRALCRTTGQPGAVPVLKCSDPGGIGRSFSISAMAAGPTASCSSMTAPI